MRIQINDNPVRWFKANHRIRVADPVLNEHFAGTYDAFLVLTTRQRCPRRIQQAQQAATAGSRWTRPARDVAGLRALVASATDEGLAGADRRGRRCTVRCARATAAALWKTCWPAPRLRSETARYFQQPEALAYIEGLQDALLATG